MATIDGQWDAQVDSPMGRQAIVLTLTTTAGGFAGAASGPLGAIDIVDGTVDGDRLAFRLAVKMPMPMTLDCEARRVGDDTIEGTVDTGAFGKFPMRAVRKA